MYVKACIRNFVCTSIELHPRQLLHHGKPFRATQPPGRGFRCDAGWLSLHVDMVNAKVAYTHAHWRTVGNGPVVVESDRISTDSRLLRSKSISLQGISVSHLEAPFSRDRSIALLALCGIEFFASSSFCFRPSSCSLRTSLTKVCTLASSGFSWDCAMYLSARGALTLMDAEYSDFAVWTETTY